MSLARLSDTSDVYVIGSVLDGYSCINCDVRFYSFHVRKAGEMLAHLREHAALGRLVPADCIERLTLDSRGAGLTP